VRMLKGLAVVLAAAAALAGCGGPDDVKHSPAVSNDQRAIFQAIDVLQTASREGDADKICNELFTKSLAKSIQKASKRTCQAEVRKTLTSPDAQLSAARNIDIKGSRATATVRERDGSSSTVDFVKEANRWRIQRIKPVESQ
jgi:hypothetical protein